MRARTSTPDDAKRVTMQVSTAGIVCNAALTVFKLVAGIVAHSSAIVADAVHSASDILGSLIVMIGAVFSHKAADASHPYGHEKLECIASILLGNILVVVGAASAPSTPAKLPMDESASDRWCHASALSDTERMRLAAAIVYQYSPSLTTMDTTAAMSASTPGRAAAAGRARHRRGRAPRARTRLSGRQALHRARQPGVTRAGKQAQTWQRAARKGGPFCAHRTAKYHIIRAKNVHRRR